LATLGVRHWAVDSPVNEPAGGGGCNRQSDKFRAFRLLKHAAADSGRSFLFGVLLLTFSAAAAVGVALLFAPLFDRAILPGDMRLIALLAGAQLTLTLAQSITTAAGTGSLASFGASIARVLAERLHHQMARQPLGYFISTGRGTMLQLLRDDVAVLEAGAGLQAGQSVVAGLQILIGLVAIGTINPMLLLLAGLGLIGAVFWSKVAVRWQAADLRREIKANVHVAELMLRNLGVDGVFLRTKASPDWVWSRVADALMEHAQSVVRRRTRSTWAHQASNITIAAAQFGFFLVGGVLVIGNSLSVGALIAAAALLMLVSGGAQQLMGAISGLSDATTRLDRIAGTLDELALQDADEEASGETNSQRKLETPPTVVFENVSLSYRPGEMAVDDASFSMDAGTLTALIGPSGAGKSSILFLLLRLVEPDEGEITLGGIDIGTLAREPLWKTVGFGTQDPPFFSASVRENLTLGRIMQDAEIERACRHAGILDRVMASPEGLDADMGESGFRFSTGERKRLAIARALIGQPLILILDEPTANVDPESEEAIIATMRKNADDGLTVLLVTHSAVAAAAADRQIRLERGRVIETADNREIAAAP